MTAPIKVLGMLLVVAVLSVVVLRGGDDGHAVTLTVPSALYFEPGLEVREAGQKVGEVTAATVTPQASARITLQIKDRGWPLPTGTKVRLRMGGTIAYSGRWVEITKPSGPTDVKLIPDGGAIPPADVTTPVEFDDMFGTFDPATRRGLRSTVMTLGRAVKPAGPGLRRSLRVAPAAVREARLVVADLNHDEQALRTLVRSGDRVTAAVAESAPGLDRLLTSASVTFQAVSARSRELQSVLEDSPRLLVTTRSTLGRAATTLDKVDGLTSRLAGGITQTRRIAPVLNGLLRTLYDVAPDARATLATGRRSAPDVRTLLRQSRAIAPKLISVATDAAQQLKCIRPYTPEIVGFAQNWAGFTSLGDHRDKFARINPINFLLPNTMPTSPAQATKLLPGLKSIFPRPPGWLAGKPWYLPDCGVGADKADPANDPETTTGPLGRASDR